jgi:CBS domain containing-hemolysin-like protein
MSATLNGMASTRLIGAASVAVAIAALAVANFATEGENGGAGPFAVTSVIAIGVAALLFGRVVPRATEGRNPARIALVLAGLTLLTGVVFWSGLPLVLGPAAIVLGLAARRNGGSIAAVGIGSLAYLASLVACAIG